MRINRKQLKRDMKAAIRDGKTSIVWIALAFLAIVLVLQYLSLAVSGDLAVLTQALSQTLQNPGAVPAVQEQTSPLGSLLVAAIDIMSILLSVGFTIACLSTARRQGAAVGNLFDGFSMFLRSLSVSLLRSLLLSLYGMLYVVPVIWLSSGLGAWAQLICLPLLLPAVCAYYSYRQALYLMLDEPGLSAIGCLRVSRRIMAGHRWELFVFDLSFLGWLLLSVFPLAIIWVMPYIQVCGAGYYDALIQPYREKGEAQTPEKDEEV